VSLCNILLKLNIINCSFYSSAVIGVVATAVIVNPAPPVVFKVDHPFLVFLVEEHDKIPLFASRVIDPTAS
jgi:serine protease inhibitor